MASTTETVRIHYFRPPNREDVFVQHVLERRPDCVVTFLPAAPLAAPLEVDGQDILEPGAPIIWFTFPGEHHDIGRFHRADGTFTGIYANVLTPVEGIDTERWRTTDLYLDVWLAPGRAPCLLDADELARASEAGWLDSAAAERARREAERILAGASAGSWPPPVVAKWPLPRVPPSLRRP